MNSSSVRWPTFLGIGVPKAGSTWLYEMLDSHPQIWVPPHEREVHFFDRYFHDRDLDWYGQFFPDHKSSEYRAIGEVTPHYIYCQRKRIAELKRVVPSVGKIILLLRNPVDRLYSHYWFWRRINNSEISFVNFVKTNQKYVEWGKYAKYIDRWLEYFDRRQFLILTVEKDIGKISKTRKRIANFLQVDAEMFPSEAGSSKKNARYMPRFGRAYAFAAWLGRVLDRKIGVRWPRTIARRMGIKRLFGSKQVDKKMDSETRNKLAELYESDVRDLEELIGREFEEWDLLPEHST